MPLNDEQRRAENRERSRAYYAANKDKIRAYYQANKDKFRERKQRYLADPKKRQSIIEGKRRYYELNKVQIKEREAQKMADPEKKKRRLESVKRSNEKRKEQKAAWARAWRAANPEIVRQKKRLWKIKNPAVYAEQCRRANKARVERCQSDAEYRLGRRARDWIANLAPEHAERRRERARNRHLKRYQTDPAYRARYLARTLTRELRAKPSPADRAAVLEFYVRAKTTPQLYCRWCGKRLSLEPGSRHVDHIVPVSRGGKTVVSNLCVTCPTCNISKGAKLPEEFLAWRSTAKLRQCVSLSPPA